LFYIVKIPESDGNNEWSSVGIRLASQDGLENLGVGALLQNTDGDEMQSLGAYLESTDDLDNLKVGTSAMNRDGDEHTNFGIKFSFDE